MPSDDGAQLDRFLGRAHAIPAVLLLRRRPGIGISQLAEALDAPFKTVSALVSHLERSELLSVTRHVNQVKSTSVHLSPLGEDLARELSTVAVHLFPADVAGHRPDQERATGEALSSMPHCGRHDAPRRMVPAVIDVQFPRGALPVAGYRCPEDGEEMFDGEAVQRAQERARELGLFGAERVTRRKLRQVGSSLSVTLDPEVLEKILPGAKPGDEVEVGLEGDKIVVRRVSPE
jgi:DNA-binding MarR family transcriptional regulator